MSYWNKIKIFILRDIPMLALIAFGLLVSKINNTKLIGGGKMAEEKIITIMGVDYIVSSDGKVYSTNVNGFGPVKYHQEISQRKNADGYMQITVGKTGHRSQYRVHRMVAEAFIPNPDNLPEVNHKDYNR